MDRIKFDEFWIKCLVPFKEKAWVGDQESVILCHKKKYKLWKVYLREFNALKRLAREPACRLDRHKVSALMIKAILDVRPLDIKKKKQNTKPKVYLANEILAFGCALSILQSYILSDARSSGDSEKYAIFQDGFVFPQVNHSGYVHCIVMNLYLNYGKRRFDVLAFSNILFMIENYTYLLKSRVDVSYA